MGGPDDSLVMTGDLFSNRIGVDRGGDTEFLVYGQTAVGDAVQAPARIQLLDGLKAAITLPASLPPWSTYLVWPKNEAGYGNPVVINRTEIWWINPEDKVSRGGLVSVFGRNLSHGGGTSASWIYVKPPGGAGQWIIPTTVTPYRVQFTVPGSLSTGAYEVWVHNGHGGSLGWSGPITLNVEEAFAWDGDIFNVRDFGATGDGVTDDADAIRAANYAALIAREQSGRHPTLYFPAGTYLMRYGFALEHELRYLGDGRDRTTLKCRSDFNSPGRAGDPMGGNLGLLFCSGGNPHDIEVRGLTLDATGVRRETGVEFWAVKGAWASASDVRFVDVRIKTDNPVGCSTTHGTTRLSFVDCEFVGGELFLYHDCGVEIRRCSFLNANGQLASIHELTVSNLSITECRLQDLDPATPAGRGQGRLLAGNANQGAQSHAYIADNVTIDLGPEPGENAGEQILCEGGVNTYDRGPVAGAGPSTVTFRDPLGTDYGTVSATAVIVAGKGLGQYRRVTGSDGDRTLSVSPAWNVPPDATSVVLVEAGTSRWVIFHNTLDGRSHYATAYSAMTAVEPYGGCYEWIADRNNITNMRTALFVAAVQDPVSAKNCIHPCYFHFYGNNLIRDCYRGILVGCGSPDSNLDPGVGFLGCVFRNNVLTDILDRGVSETTFQTTTPASPGCAFDLTLFEHNLFSDIPFGFDCDLEAPALVKNTVAYRNTFSLGTADPVGSVGVAFGSTALTPVFSENTWTGFAATYSGTPPGSLIDSLKPTDRPTGIRVQVWTY